MRVFLVQRLQTIVYTFKEDGVIKIYHAGTLENIERTDDMSFTDVSGICTDRFGVKPCVLGYADGRYSLVYAPPDRSRVCLFDGGFAKHNNQRVKSRCTINIPGPDMKPLDLAEPNDGSIKEYIRMAKRGLQYDIPLSTDKAETDDLMEALTRRLYQLYPVMMPRQVDGVKVIDYDELTKITPDNPIEKSELIPIYQPYAGSHRSNNRFITVTLKDGKRYHVRASYDAKTNNIDRPK